MSLYGRIIVRNLMTRLFLCCLITLVAMTISGCMTSPGSFGWVTDPDQYLKMSGFSIQAPTGQNWARAPQNDSFPNSIVFTKLMQTPIRNNAERPEFSVTVAAAYGTPIVGRVSGNADKDVDKKALQHYLQQRQGHLKYLIHDSSHDIFQGAKCVHYTGKQLDPEKNSYWGVINFERLSGYLCLHPDYDDFLVGIEWKEGASVGQTPANRDDQLGHFIRSLRFTPRKIPGAPAGEKSKDEGKRIIS